MATAYYSMPAAANYFTPSPHQHRKRGMRLCDNCNAIERPDIERFRLCGGCMTTNYCSTDCQKVHWSSHRTICKHTAEQIALAKQQPISTEHPGQDMARLLRSFTSTHTELLAWAAFQALQLKRARSNVRQSALLVELSFRGGSDSRRKFAIKGTHIVSRAYVTANDSLVAADIHRRDDRCIREGGIGCAVVIIQCGEISQVMPAEVDNPSHISWDERGDWDSVLRHFIDAGRSDFKPISTTARGVRYG